MCGKNGRQLFRDSYDFVKTNRFCHMEHGFWQETYDNWKEELPPGVIYPELFSCSENDLFTHFDILKFGYIRPEIYMVPPLETKILEETDEYIVIKNGNGAILKTSKLVKNLPQELGYAVTCGRDYMEYRERLTDPALDIRINQDVQKSMEQYNSQEAYAAVCTHSDGFFAYVRELLGVENGLMEFYDEPDFMKLLLKDRVEFYKKVYEPILKAGQIDFAFLWEDMCYKNGPLLSPSLFEEFLVPAYKELISFMQDFGVKRFVVDSDGDVMALLPLWMGAGINGLLPFEVQSGMDVVKIGEQYEKLTIFGGINKYEIAKSRQAIDDEINRVLPFMAKRGGYIPTLDHWVPPDISYDLFCYYNEKIQNFTF